MVVPTRWEDQWRQCHIWFGHGTASTEAALDASVIGLSTANCVLALAYGALASLPAAQRRQAKAQYHNGTLPLLKEAMTAWLRTTALDQAAFASRLFGRSADDPVVRSLHSAALRAATATSLSTCGKRLASLPGPWRWLASSSGRALSPTPRSAPATRPRRLPSRGAGSRTPCRWRGSLEAYPARPQVTNKGYQRGKRG